MTSIRISRLHFPVTTLGPGNRIGIWLQGCTIRCLGCISADTWSDRSGSTTVAETLDAIDPWIASADGFTISGGEPFDQPDALLILLSALRTVSAADILVFSGYPFNSIRSYVEQADGAIDALISEPFDIDAPQTLLLRGSDNQQLHMLTPLGRKRFAKYDSPARPEDKSFDLMLDASGSIWLAGIPSRDDFSRLTPLLTGQGHRLVTSQDRRSRRSTTGKQ